MASENFIYAYIQPGNLGPNQPDPVRPGNAGANGKPLLASSRQALGLVGVDRIEERNHILGTGCGTTQPVE